MLKKYIIIHYIKIMHEKIHGITMYSTCYEIFDNSCNIACVSNVLRSIDPRVSTTTPVT